jgi:hypothetical protein
MLGQEVAKVIDTKRLKEQCGLRFFYKLLDIISTTKRTIFCFSITRGFTSPQGEGFVLLMIKYISYQIFLSKS